MCRAHTHVLLVASGHLSLYELNYRKPRRPNKTPKEGLCLTHDHQFAMSDLFQPQAVPNWGSNSSRTLSKSHTKRMKVKPGLESEPSGARRPFPGLRWLAHNTSCVCVFSCSAVSALTAPWTAARQAPLSMGFPRPECWSGLRFPLPGDLPDPGSNLCLLRLPHWQADPLPLLHSRKPYMVGTSWYSRDQWSPTFWPPGTNFTKDSFSMGCGVGGMASGWFKPIHWVPYF